MVTVFEGAGQHVVDGRTKGVREPRTKGGLKPELTIDRIGFGPDLQNLPHRLVDSWRRRSLPHPIERARRTDLTDRPDPTGVPAEPDRRAGPCRESRKTQESFGAPSH